MNQYNCVGRLVKDIELMQSNSVVAKFTLAVNRKFKKEGKPDADFPKFVAFGKTAEIMEKYLSKGNQVAVTGRLETDSYENKEGQKVYTTDIIVESFTFVGGGDQTTNNSTGNQQNNNQSNQNSQSNQQGNNNLTGFQTMDLDSDIPF